MALAHAVERLNETVKASGIAKFMSKLLNHPQVKPPLSDEHFSVDGTLIEVWASQKSLRPRDGSGDADGGANFHPRSNKRMGRRQHRRPRSGAPTGSPQPGIAKKKIAGRAAAVALRSRSLVRSTSAPAAASAAELDRAAPLSRA